MSNWEWKKLGDVCEVIAGQSPQSSAYNSEGFGLEFHQGKKAFGKRVIQPSKVWTKEYTKIAKKGDILMSVRAPVGPVNFTDREVCIGRGLAAIRNTSTLDENFLFYYFINNESKMTSKVGAVFDSINRSDIQKFVIPIPPLAEQKRIVKTLDEKFAKIDKLKTAAETNLKNAREIFNAELNSKLNVENDNLPQGWERKKICEVCDVTSSKRIFKDEYVENGIPFYRTKEIKELAHGLPISLELFISRDKYNSIKKKYGVPQIGDVLISAVGTIGEVLVIENDNPFYFKDGNIVWLKNIKSLDPFYLKYKLISITENLKAMTRGAAYNALTIEKLEVCSIPLPPLSEQKRIVAHLDKLSEKVKRLEEIYRRTIADCEELKKSILKKTFEGES